MHCINTATATAPQLPTREQAAATWAVLAACWAAASLTQQQHQAALAAVTSDAAAAAARGEGITAGGTFSLPSDSATVGNSEAATAQLRSVLLQLSESMHSSSAEADAARVQFVASKALSAACEAVTAAAAAAAAVSGCSRQVASPAAASPQQQQTGELGGSAAASAAAVGGAAAWEPDVVVPKELHSLQLQLAALQAAMVEYEQSGLSFILDPSTSHLSEELPEAAPNLEDLLDAGETDQAAAAAAMLRAQQQPASQQQHWQQQLLALSVQLQLLPQLLLAFQYEALAPIAAWHAANQAAREAELPGTPQTLQQQQPLLLPAGPVSQQQLWSAAADHIRQHWQQLQQLLLQAIDLEGHMHALAAVAAAGGAAAIWPEDTDLMSRAIALQQMLLPQGFDILTTEECVASAQLLQAQWTDLEQRLWAALAETLCPMLGLGLGVSLPAQPQGGVGTVTFNPAALGGVHGGQVEHGAGVAVLRQLLEAAGASVGSAAIMHCKDVLDVLGVGSAAGGGDAGSSGSMWGVPGVSEAWRCLVLLLLQYGCLQQQLLRSAQQQENSLDTAAAEAAITGAEGCVDVLRSSKPLPLEVEVQRPLFTAVQALFELLCCHHTHSAAAAAADGASLSAAAAGGVATAAAARARNLSGSSNVMQGSSHRVDASAAAPGQVDLAGQSTSTAAFPPAGVAATSLQQQLQSILLPPLLQQLLPLLQQQLGSLQRHLSDLAAEAGGVLARFQPPRTPHRQLQQLQDGLDISQDAAAGGAGGARGSQELGGLGSMAAGEDGANLVPFDAFDMSLPGADMLLEELGGLEDGDGNGDSFEAAAASDADGEDAFGSSHGSRAAVSGAADGSGAAAGASAGAGLPQLVPFDAFDEGLEGAGMLLEDGSEGGGDAAGFFADMGSDSADLLGGALEEQTGLQLQGGNFSSSRHGAGAVSAAGGGNAGGFFGDMGPDSADLLGGALEGEEGDEQTGLGLEVQGIEDGNNSWQGAAAVSAAGAGGADTTASGASLVEGAAHLAEVDALAELLLVSGRHAAAVLLKQQLLAGLQQVQGSCTWQQQVWLRHLAAFEWLWGDILQLQEEQHAGQGSKEEGTSRQQQQQQHLRNLLQGTAAALGVPLHGTSAGGVEGEVSPGEAYQRFCAGLLPQLPPLPSAVAGAHAGTRAGTAEDPQHQQQQHMPTSLQLLQSWQVLCEQQTAAADALQAWRGACAAAVTAVGDVLLGGLGQGLQVADPMVCRKVG